MKGHLTSAIDCFTWTAVLLCIIYGLLIGTLSWAGAECMQTKSYFDSITPAYLTEFFASDNTGNFSGTVFIALVSVFLLIAVVVVLLVAFLLVLVRIHRNRLKARRLQRLRLPRLANLPRPGAKMVVNRRDDHQSKFRRKVIRLRRLRPLKACIGERSGASVSSTELEDLKASRAKSSRESVTSLETSQTDDHDGVKTIYNDYDRGRDDYGQYYGKDLADDQYRYREDSPSPGPGSPSPGPGPGSPSPGPRGGLKSEASLNNDKGGNALAPAGEESLKTGQPRSEIVPSVHQVPSSLVGPEHLEQAPPQQQEQKQWQPKMQEKQQIIRPPEMQQQIIQQPEIQQQQFLGQQPQQIIYIAPAACPPSPSVILITPQAPPQSPTPTNCTFVNDGTGKKCIAIMSPPPAQPPQVLVIPPIQQPNNATPMFIAPQSTSPGSPQQNFAWPPLMMAPVGSMSPPGSPQSTRTTVITNESYRTANESYRTVSDSFF